VAGVGISDAEYSPIKTKCPFYVVWQSMLVRCYSQRMLTRNPTYAGCSVTPEWHRFTTFRLWMGQQNWVGKQLDKDLRIPGNREYGPQTCLFVSHQINGLLSTQPKQRGDLPIGVTRCGDKYKTTLKKERKTYHIGVYPTISGAAAAYILAKANWIEELAGLETCPVTCLILYSAVDAYRKSIP
jgi:hypothetical protein